MPRRILALTVRVAAPAARDLALAQARKKSQFDGWR